MTIDRECLVISKKLGEQAINQLQQLQILDTTLRIRKDKNHLYLPILEGINQDLDLGFKYQLSKKHFEKKKSMVRSVKKVLADKISKEELDYLPRSFDQIGNIIVVEIKEEVQKYKKLIGETLLSFYPNTKSIFMKITRVDGGHRIRGTELIAGDNETATIHLENGIRLHIDVKKVYFSPRLSFEHRRVSKYVSPGNHVLDMFCGIGPFVIYLAKQFKAEFYAIDINPDAIRLLKKSIKLNKGLKGAIIPINDDILNFEPPNSQKFDLIIMNHPSEALDFLNFAYELTKPGGTILCYIFAPKENRKEFCQNRVKSILKVNFVIRDITTVRGYSFFDDHVCIEISKNASSDRPSKIIE